MDKALEAAQNKLKTSFTFMTEPMPRRNPHKGCVMMVGRSGRGNQDKNLFIVYADPDETSQLSTKNLRVIAGHEALHAVLWELSEFANEEEGGKGHADAVTESVTYQLQRIIFGEIGAAKE